MRSSAESTACWTASGIWLIVTFCRLPCSPGATRAITLPSENATVLSWLSTAESAFGTGMNSQPSAKVSTGTPTHVASSA